MLLQEIDLTTALRPLLLPDETLLFVQDGVGLYKGYIDSIISFGATGKLKVLLGSTKSLNIKMDRPI